jgi:pseudo-rSAM protein
LHFAKGMDASLIATIATMIDSSMNSYLSSIKIFNYGQAIFEYAELWNKLREVVVTIDFMLDYDKQHMEEQLESIKQLSLNNVHITIRTESPFTAGTLDSIQSFVDEFGENVKLAFFVKTEEEFMQVQDMVEDKNIRFTVKPYFDGTNLDFMEQFVYMDEKDMQNIQLTKKEIFAHQVLNTNDFGKIAIDSSGDVYSNINLQKSIGNVSEDIRDIIFREMKSRLSWRRIRNMRPCSECLYQWLCPSPSNHEIAIGKPNLCRIK